MCSLWKSKRLNRRATLSAILHPSDVVEKKRRTFTSSSPFLNKLTHSNQFLMQWVTHSIGTIYSGKLTG